MSVQTVGVEFGTVVVDGVARPIEVEVGALFGPPGQGVPTGGDLHDFLRKASATHYDTEWVPMLRGTISDIEPDPNDYDFWIDSSDL